MGTDAKPQDGMAEPATEAPARGAPTPPVRQAVRAGWLQPQTLDDALKLAKLMSDSDLVPKEFKGKPQNVLIAVQLGAEVGLAPMQSLQNIAVINGRPCMWGDALLAVVQDSRKMEWHREWLEGSEDDPRAVFESKRTGYPEAKKTVFSWKDAHKAGLLSKDSPWKTYPKRMLQMRARGFGLRDQYADVLKGLISREEAEDIIEAVQTALPKPMRESAPELPGLATEQAEPQEAGEVPVGWTRHHESLTMLAVSLGGTDAETVDAMLRNVTAGVSERWPEGTAAVSQLTPEEAAAAFRKLEAQKAAR